MAEPAQLTEPAPAISPAQSYVVEARRLAKSYRPTVAVADVDLLVERGFVFGALGPSWRCLLCCWRFCAPRSGVPRDSPSARRSGPTSWKASYRAGLERDRMGVTHPGCPPQHQRGLHHDAQRHCSRRGRRAAAVGLRRRTDLAGVACPPGVGGRVRSAGVRCVPST